ncbi:MAG: hypothetical protein A4E31_01039 [Methanomassiliicoccales archaeon PtaU1.Bin030]|nr:MAG: hypothetical protein A4E31_01039 [Methanomassiliicoccales archaeon PtaU1.Bin030]
MARLEKGDELLKWHTRCFLCPNKLRCRDEKVARGSKKCLNLLRHHRRR